MCDGHSPDDDCLLRRGLECHCRATRLVVTRAEVGSTAECSCYIPDKDKILITRNDLWDDIGHHFSTTRHELTHWTGHKARLNRPQLTGEKLAYAFEELVAEIGAAMMCARDNVAYRLDNHASYIESWSRVLAGDATALFRASEKATKAVAFIDSKSEIKIESEK